MYCSLAVSVGFVAGSVQPTIQDLSFLGLKESSNGHVGRKNAEIIVKECSTKTIDLILKSEYITKIKLASYYCYLKDLERRADLCKRRCRISRAIGKCRDVESKLANIKSLYDMLRKQEQLWSKRLTFCMKCRTLVEYRIQQSKGMVPSTHKVGGSNYSDPAYTLKNLLDALLARELASVELLYVNKKHTSPDISKLFCGEKNKTLCKCFKKGIKDLVGKKDSLKEVIKNKDMFIKRCFSFLSQSPGGIPKTGEQIVELEQECRMVNEVDMEVEQEVGGTSNQVFTEE